MTLDAPTFTGAARLPLHWSAFWVELTRRAGGPREVTNWLIAQANARGFHGAVVARTVAVDSWLTLENLVVGLLMPHAELDARVVKLVVRLLQSDQLDAEKLAFRARRERADVGLTWVLSLVPDGERPPPARARREIAQAAAGGSASRLPVRLRTARPPAGPEGAVVAREAQVILETLGADASHAAE